MLYLCFRNKYKCKQYVFTDPDDIYTYFDKKWYQGELIKCQVYANRCHSRTFFFKAGELNSWPQDLPAAS